jgi:hypothetical protein
MTVFREFKDFSVHFETTEPGKVERIVHGWGGHDLAPGDVVELWSRGKPGGPANWRIVSIERDAENCFEAVVTPVRHLKLVA